MALHDALLQLQPETTKNADFLGAAFLVMGMAGIGSTGTLFVEVTYKAAADAQAPADSTAQFNVEHSFDGGNTWHLLTSGASDRVTLTAVPKSGRFSLPVNTEAGHIRLVLDVTAGEPGVSIPTITYTAYLTVSRI